MKNSWILFLLILAMLCAGAPVEKSAQARSDSSRYLKIAGGIMLGRIALGGCASTRSHGKFGGPPRGAGTYVTTPGRWDYSTNPPTWILPHKTWQPNY